MLADVVEHLICPVCGDGLALGERVLRCPRGHAFDIAKQGYVSLLTGSQIPGTADSTAMVAARDAFLGAGHFGPLADAVADACRTALRAGDSAKAGADGAEARTPARSGSETDTGTRTRIASETDAGTRTRAGSETDAESRSEPRRGVILDAGAGTGYYLARVLDRLPRAAGIALDVSKHAVRRAARAHARLGAVVADVWRPLPVRDDTAHVLLNVFAPRNGAEFARVLRRDGTLVVVTPTSRHLEPLVERLGLLSVDESKERRMAESLSGHFTETGRRTYEFPMALDRAAVEAVVGMGPSAWHTESDDIRRKITELAESSEVTASFRLSTFESRS